MTILTAIRHFFGDQPTAFLGMRGWMIAGFAIGACIGIGIVWAVTKEKAP